MFDLNDVFRSFGVNVDVLNLPVAVYKKEDNYVVVAEVAGASKDTKDISINVDGADLVITDTRERMKSEDKPVLGVVDATKRVARIRIENADFAGTKASIEDGLLTVVVPALKKKTTEIKIG